MLRKNPSFIEPRVYNAKHCNSTDFMLHKNPFFIGPRVYTAKHCNHLMLYRCKHDAFS